MAGFFKRLRGLFFDDSASRSKEEDNEKSIATSSSKARPSGSIPPPRARGAYIVQIGLDFGTAFSKCVCRDIIVGNRAWVHLPSRPGDKSLPFLISSSLCFRNGVLSHQDGNGGSYAADVLPHIKMALEKVALKQWNEPVLSNYKGRAAEVGGAPLAAFVENCAIYLLAGILGSVREDIAERFPGKVQGDTCAVNMAVPVANAEDPAVSAIFNRVLRAAWVLADEFRGFPEMPWSELDGKVSKARELASSPAVEHACFVYPEVSANVQGFVRSRTSQPGIYLFSDTGAGTVDQGVFIFVRSPERGDQLTYLNSKVLALGSSQIDRLAAEYAGSSGWESLEQWRLKKEKGGTDRALQEARKEIGAKLANWTSVTISEAKGKLFNPLQISQLRVLFGGGGHAESPYGTSVIGQFDGNLFHPDKIKKRRQRGESFEVGLPIPPDLQLSVNQHGWMKRLTVAYGLSFEKGDLADFVLPRDVKTPGPDQVWKPRRNRADAPSKDEV